MMKVQTVNISKKNQWAAYLLCFFFGFFGAHYFYVRRTRMGILFLFTGGIFGVGSVIDLIKIACGTFRDSTGAFLRFDSKNLYYKNNKKIVFKKCFRNAYSFISSVD